MLCFKNLVLLHGPVHLSFMPSLRIVKDAFKFSSAHFLIFDQERAEKLHGHNYQVEVEIFFDDSSVQENQGFFCDFGEIKRNLKSLVDAWDEHVLLPALHPEMNYVERDNSLEVRFRNRFYVFPQDEVIQLPIINTSVENLSRLLAEKLAEKLKHLRYQRLLIRIDETSGQGASYGIVPSPSQFIVK